jgi:hypothetical protein
MKKLLFVMMFMLTCQATSAQEALELIHKYRVENKAEYLSVPHVLVSIAAMKAKDERSRKLLRQVRSVKVLSLEDCSPDVRKNFVQGMSELTSKGYEEYIRVKDEGDTVLVLMKENGRHVGEIVILTTDEEDCVALLVSGKINRADIGNIINVVGD